jgi:hypothetical protein
MQARKAPFAFLIIPALVLGLSIVGVTHAFASAPQTNSASQSHVKPVRTLNGSVAISHHTGAMAADGTRGVSTTDVVEYINTVHPQGAHWNLEGVPQYDVHLATIAQVSQLLHSTTMIYSGNEQVYVVTFHNKNTVVPYYGAKPLVTYQSILVYDSSTGNFLLSVAIAPKA